MNETIKLIVGALEAGKPELQVAAAQILGELRAKEPTVVKALGGALRRSHVLGRFSLDALARIGTADAWQTIARAMVEIDGLADHATHLLAEAGTVAHPVLAAAYDQAVGDQRTRILGILARSLGKESVAVFVHALLTPETTEHAARLLHGAAPQFDASLQKALREGLGVHLEGALPETCLAQVVAVLAKVDPAGSRALLLQFTAKGTPSLVRAAALRSLVGSKLSAAQVKGLMDLLEDQGERDVHDAVRDVLAQLPEVPEALVPVLKRLLLARQPEQRLFALRMLRTAGGSDLAKTALKLLDHADERFRAAAAEALAHNKHAIEPLVRLLQTARDPALAQVAAGILVRLGPHMAPRLLKALAEKAVKLVSSNTRVGDLLLDVVLSAGGAKVVPTLVEKAVRLRRARRHAEALHVLARLAGTPHGSDEGRYQLALTKLLLDVSRPAAESVSPGNPTMGFFAALVRSGFPLAQRLRKESAVTPEAMLRVASHFADAVGVERRFGTELLQHLASRTKGRAGEEARMALRVVGG